MANYNGRIPQYWESKLQEALYPNLYFSDGSHWSMTPHQRAKNNWNDYPPWFQDFLTTTFGEKLEIPDWTLGKVFQGQIGSMYGVKILQSNATKVRIPKLK